MTKKKVVGSAPSTSTALVPIAGTALVPILKSEKALARLPGAGGSVARERGVTLVTDRPYATHERVIPASEIYYVDDAKPREDGPWLGEADKVAWKDDASGYECIMLRDRHEAFLSGYVGVPQDHPLWGWGHEAVAPALGIEVHGGLTYSQICQEGPSPTRDIVMESRRICHVPVTPPRYGPIEHATDYRVDDPHAFWFGFDCNHIYDIVPNGRGHRQRFLSAETAAAYRDDAYVVREIVNLAAQLKAIADDTPAPTREGPPLPPIGLDPQRGG